MRKIISVALVSIMSLQSVLAGGGMSTVTFGVGFDGGGRHNDTFFRAQDRLGRPTADLHFGGPPEPAQLPTPALHIPTRSSDAWRRAEDTFTVQNRFAYSFGVHNIGGAEYHFAKSATTELLTLPARKWEISTYTGYDATTTFSYRNETERLAMRSFHFEETPLLWHFGREMIGGQWYNHAWTDTFLDMLIPDGKLMNISAPEWYTKERKERASLAAATPVTVQDKSEGLLQESVWSVIHAALSSREPEARRAAAAAYQYATTARDLAADFAADLVIPGGIENCRKYSRNEISTGTFVQKITEDVRDDAIAAMIGSIIGGGTGAASAALAGVGAMAIPGAIIGAEKGAAIGVVISRAVKASMRSSGGGRSGGGRTERVERQYKQGDFFDGLIKDRTDGIKQGLGGKDTDKILGEVQRAKRVIRGDIRADRHGNLYKFDPAHKTGKVHLEKIEAKGSHFEGVAEVDPNTGKIIEQFVGTKIRKYI